MSVDYDVARTTPETEDQEDGLISLATRGPAAAGPGLDTDMDEPLELPAADLSGEDLVVTILPRQADEFTCVGCFLVQHKSRVARSVADGALCPECA